MELPNTTARDTKETLWTAPGHRAPQLVPLHEGDLLDDDLGSSSDRALPTTRAAEETPEPATADSWPDVVDLFIRAGEDEYTSKLVGAIKKDVLLRPAGRSDRSLLLRCQGSLDVSEDVTNGAADIELVLEQRDLARLAEGTLRAAMAIAGGRATYEGPVRQFLRVLPMVQAIVRPPVAVGTNTIHDGVEEIV